jgi:flagellar hook assembly protein FlgD
MLVKVTPNPIRARASIRVELAGSGGAAQLPVQVYDATGRLVRTLAARRGGGTYEVEWDARSESGDLAPAGIYFVRATADEGTGTARVTILR